MRLQTRSRTRCTVLKLDGALAPADMPALRNELGKAVARADGAVVCDVSGLTAADPTVMTIFATTHRDDAWPGPVVRLAGATGPVAETVERLGLERFLPVHRTVSEAIAAAREGTPRLCSVMSLDVGASAPRRARRFVADTCEQWGLFRTTDDAIRVVSELATNAVEHAHTDLVVRLERSPDRLFIAVYDRADDPTARWWIEGGGDDAESDRAKESFGLSIVRALSVASGVYPNPGGGKVVWAALVAEAPSAAGPAHLRPGVDPEVVVRSTQESGHVEARSRPVRARITVNAGPARAAGGPRWTVRLDLSWRPADPEVVAVTVVSRPAHPALPRGSWEVPRAVLRAGLERAAEHNGMHLRPERGGRQVVMELPMSPPRPLRLPAWRLRIFLSATVRAAS